MSKLLSNISKNILKVIFGFALLLLIIMGMLHSSIVTSTLGKYGSKIASDYIGFPIHFDNIDINIFTRTATVKGFQILDRYDSNMLSAERVTATLKSYDFKKFTIKKLSIIRPDWNIHVPKGDTSPDFEKVLFRLAALKKDTTKENPFLIENAEAIDGKFKYNNENYEWKGIRATDFKHITLTNFNVKGRNILIYKKHINFIVDHADFIEHNGFTTEDFEGVAQINQRTMHLTKLKVKTPTSKFALNLHFYYRGYYDFRDFINNVRMEGDIEPNAVLDLSDLAYFAFPLHGMDGITQVAGRVTGTVADLHCIDVKMSGGKNFNIETDVHLKGLIDYKNTAYNIDVKNFSLTKEDLDYITLPDKWQFKTPKNLQSLSNVNLQGNFNGTINSFGTQINLSTNIGKVIADVRLSGGSTGDTIGGTMGDSTGSTTGSTLKTIQGKFDISDLQLGNILPQQKYLGSASALLNLNSEGKSLKTMSHNINGVITALRFNGFKGFNGRTINNIDADVNIGNRILDCKVNTDDNDLSFSLDGWMDFQDTSLLQLNYNLDLRKADLQALNLVDDTVPFVISTKLKGQNTGIDFDDISCDIVLRETKINNKIFDLNLPKITLFVGMENDMRHLVLASDLLRVNIDGKFSVSEFPNLYRHLKKTFYDEKSEKDTVSLTPPPAPMPEQNFTAKIMISDADYLAGIISPKLQWSEQLNLTLSCNTKENKYSLNANLPYIAYQKIGYLNGKITAFTAEDMLFIQTTADKLFLDDSIYMSDFIFQTNFAGRNTVNWGIHWLNNEDDHENDHENISENARENDRDSSFAFGNLKGTFSYLENEKRWKVSIDNSGMRFEGRNWIFEPNSFIEGDTHNIVINNFVLHNNQEKISVSGMLSKAPDSKLEINIKDVNISYLDVLYLRFGMDLDGYISGKIELWDVYNSIDIVSDIFVDKFYINGDNYGGIGLKTKYDRKNSTLFGTIDVSLPDKNIPLLSLDGAIYVKKNNALDFKGVAKDLPVNFLENYMSSFSSDIQGTVSGNLRLEGTLKKPQFYTEVSSNNFKMGIDILNTVYAFDTCSIKVSPSEISFPFASFREATSGGRGRLQGKITHDFFKNITPDLQIDVANTLVLNVPYSKAVPYSGTVFASGTCAIKGNTSSNIDIVVNGRTEKNSNVTFNTESAYEGALDFITFEKKEVKEEIIPKYTYVSSKRRNDDKSKTVVTMELNVDATPDALVNMGIKNSAITGNLSARGSGRMRFVSNPNATMLFGAYTLSSGTFDFSMSNVIERQFALRPGSTISWRGPLKDATLDLGAVYTTRTSVAPILSSTGFGGGGINQKINVESILQVQGLLSNPSIAFDINLLTSNQVIKDAVSSYVNKENQNEMLKQTFSLLLFNSFMAIEGGDITSDLENAPLSYSSDLLLGQFNNFISKISKDIDFGVNYRPGNDLNNSEVQIMMGAQFFDNRLVVEGSMGIDVDNRSGTQSSQSGVVGDVNVEWRFNDRISAKAFNRSDERDILEQTGTSYTQGVGMTYRLDFNSFKDLFTRKRKKKNFGKGFDASTKKNKNK